MEDVVAISRGAAGLLQLLLCAAPVLAQENLCSALPAQTDFHWYSDPAARAGSYDASMHIRSSEDVETSRKALRTRLLGSEELSSALPAVEVMAAGALLPTAVTAPVAVVQRLTITMPGTRAVAYYYEPKEPSATLVIYHAGHEAVVPDATLSELLQAGHAVVAMYMPASGPNAEHAPSIELPEIGSAKAIMHAHYELLDQPGFAPLRFFIEPVTVVLNHVLRDKRFERVTMMGLSGGGWTTTVVAAIDPRVTRSYAIAGTVPLQLRWDDWTSWGDYEQAHPALRDSYVDMYLLASDGAGRSHTQVLHKYDTCCFAMREVPPYVPLVSRRVGEIGEGQYRFFLDDTIRGHAVSPCTLSRILADLAAYES